MRGRMPPEVIQSIVRSRYGEFRSCYEEGLQRVPHLTGRVSIRFVIEMDGTVSNVSNGGSDLPDLSVIRCVMRVFGTLRFPNIEDGIVTLLNVPARPRSTRASV